MDPEADSANKTILGVPAHIAIIGFLIAVCILVFGRLFGFFPSEIALACNPQQAPVQKCPSDDFPAYLISGPLAYIDAHNGFFQALAASFSAGFAWVLYKFAKKQTLLTEAANNTAQQSADAATQSAQAAIDAQRPWIKLEAEDDGVFELNGTPPGCTKVTMIFRNLGNSPALNVRLNSWFIPQAAGESIYTKHPEADDKARKMADQWLRVDRNNPGHLSGVSIFPGEKQSFGITHQLDRNEIERFTREAKEFFVCGAVYVDYGFGSQRGRTSGQFTLFGSPGNINCVTETQAVSVHQSSMSAKLS